MMQQHSVLFMKIVEYEKRGIRRVRANKNRIPTLLFREEMIFITKSFQTKNSFFT